MFYNMKNKYKNYILNYIFDYIFDSIEKDILSMEFHIWINCKMLKYNGLEL